MSTGSHHYETFDGFSPYSGIGPYRAQDYWELEEGSPVELIRGRLVMSPAPMSNHQFLSAQLWKIVQQAEEIAGGIGYFSPIDVVLDEHNIVQPDLLYIAKDRLNQIGDRIEGPPSLIIEVLSPSTANRDRQEKLDLYAKFLVPEYWIVDPEKRSFDFLVNDNGRFIVTTSVDDIYRSAVTPEIEIRLADFWAEVDRRQPRRNS